MAALSPQLRRQRRRRQQRWRQAQPRRGWRKAVMLQAVTADAPLLALLLLLLMREMLLLQVPHPLELRTLPVP